MLPCSFCVTSTQDYVSWVEISIWTQISTGLLFNVMSTIAAMADALARSSENRRAWVANDGPMLGQLT